MATISNPYRPVGTPDGAVQQLIDAVSASLTYICEADPGALTSEAVWRIQRIQVTGAITTIQWAGNGAFNQVAANRASLSYA